MTRQLSDLSKKYKNIKINITSLTPLNPHNKPTNLEKKALLFFKKGKTEFFRNISGQYFYMGTLKAEKACLKCHKNYKIGENIGGISIIVPYLPDISVYPLAFGHFFIGLLGIAFIIYSGMKLSEAYDKIRKQAIFDGLTGIFNRREFERKLSEEFNRAKRKNAPLSIILCDIDWFKKYNDCYGHIKGDKCLKKVASAINNSLKRASDFCARFGGEEFIIVLPDTDVKGAEYIAEEIMKNIKSLNIEHKDSKHKVVTLSIGVATLTDFSDSDFLYENLIKISDTALYRAKKHGRNRVEIIKI